MASKRAKQIKPSGWALDSANIATDRVQVWRNGLMAGLVARADAVAMVNAGDAYVITDQAIGLMVDGVSVA